METLNQKNFPLQKIISFDEQYISRDIFNYITKSCTFPPIAIEEGLRFAIREGGRTVGSGVVTKINS